MQAFDMIKIERSHKKTGILAVFLLMLIVLIAASVQLSYAVKNDFHSAGNFRLISQLLVFMTEPWLGIYFLDTYEHYQ